MIRIGNRSIGPGSPVFIIAEAGLNHNGDPSIAAELIRAAVDAGADAVKFQTFKTEELVVNRGETTPVFEMFKGVELSFDCFKNLKRVADTLGIVFLSTPFDFDSLDFLVEIGVPAIKIASADLTHLPLLDRVARKGLPVILSTGMSTLDEISRAVVVLKSGGTGDIVLLHATIAHPAPLSELHLNAIETLTAEFGLPVGYSDHTEDMLAPCLAVAKGAVLIEKHFTLDKQMQGPDHLHSLDPAELKRMITEIRKTEAILGADKKGCYPVEQEARRAARRSIVARVTIPKGTTVVDGMLSYKRPGTGLPPKCAAGLIGKIALSPIEQNTVLREEMFGEERNYKLQIKN